MLLKVILYAYLQNIHSGRKMEAMLKRDVNFMWLSGMQSTWLRNNTVLSNSGDWLQLRLR